MHPKKRREDTRHHLTDKLEQLFDHITIMTCPPAVACGWFIVFVKPGSIWMPTQVEIVPEMVE